MSLGQYILKHSVAKGHDNVNIFSNISEKNGERIKKNVAKYKQSEIKEPYIENGKMCTVL